MTTIKTFWTSDAHLGHARICELADRPFTSVDEMNETIINNWNDTVSPDDIVWVLGDFVMGQKSETLPLVTRLNGTIRLVPGNHDRVHPSDKQCAKWLPQYEAVGIDVMDPEITMMVPGIDMSMCHFPFEGDSHGDDRYSDLRPEDHGQILLHGHVHEAWKVRGRQINVGVDVWDFRPVTFDQLLDALDVSLLGV